MKKDKTIIIYHANCADGFTAAWVVNQSVKSRNYDIDIELFPAHHGDEPPDVTGLDVIIVDFCYSIDVLLMMQKSASSILVLDHHKTVADEIKNLDFVIFDESRSGASIAWDHFNAVEPHSGPREGLGVLVDYVEDRDLWRWELRNSKEISAALSIVDMTIADWDRLAISLVMRRRDVVTAGKAILASQGKAVSRLAKKANVRTFLGFAGVPVVNATGLNSEIGNRLLDLHPDAPFSVTWFHRVDKDERDVIQVSLRSRDDREDVGYIAKTRWGGGHRNAAGFTMTIEDFFDSMPALAL